MVDTPAFSHRACYVNFAEHLQNAWNPNLLFPGAPNEWGGPEWQGFFRMVAGFGFNVFEYWLPPSLFDRPALSGDAVHRGFAERMRFVTRTAHDCGLRVELLAPVNTIGPGWYSACPHLPDDKALILRLWRHWMRELPQTDIVGLFPGDPGGCNRNGCTHETYIDLVLDLCGVVQHELPRAVVEMGTWGTPFSGWGSDLVSPPGWNGGFQQLLEQKLPQGVPAHIWNGGPGRAAAAMEYLLHRLGELPDNAMVAINLGFSPDGDATAVLLQTGDLALRRARVDYSARITFIDSSAAWASSIPFSNCASGRMWLTSFSPSTILSRRYWIASGYI